MTVSWDANVRSDTDLSDYARAVVFIPLGAVRRRHIQSEMEILAIAMIHNCSSVTQSGDPARHAGPQH